MFLLLLSFTFVFVAAALLSTAIGDRLMWAGALLTVLGAMGIIYGLSAGPLYALGWFVALVALALLIARYAVIHRQS